MQRPLVETRRTVPPNRRSHDFSISSKGTNINVACSTFIGADTPDLAFDGVTSFGESPRNRWACYNSGFRQGWIEWEFPEPQTLSGVVTHFFSDDRGTLAPKDYVVQYREGDVWTPVTEKKRTPARPAAGVANRALFEPVTAQTFRLLLTHQPGAYSGITEIEYTGG